MAEAYSREILRRNVAQICQTIGWNGINSTPLDILVHVLEKYIMTLGVQTSRYAEQFNRTQPNLNDLGLVFQDLNINLPELVDYVRCVPPVPLPFVVGDIKKPKETNLNFLKPGSHEVVTRPMHIHEHLPPMYPEKEQDVPGVAGVVEIKQNGVDNALASRAVCPTPETSTSDSPEKPKDVFKRPNDPVALSSKMPRLRLEEEERTREISSVMMTMSGFLSPAREGKLPEAHPPPTIISESKLHEKHSSPHHSTATPKPPVLEKGDRKSKKNKLLSGKIMKSKRKDKSHKGESGKSKDSKLFKYPSGHSIKKAKDVHQRQMHSIPVPAPKALPFRSIVPPSIGPVKEPMRTVIKQEPIDYLPSVSKLPLPSEDTIPVPKRIPISKSQLIPGAPMGRKTVFSPNLLGTEIKEEVFDKEKKLASQPDRSKINILKRISNKSKEDKTIQPEIPKLQNTMQGNPIDEIVKVEKGDATSHHTHTSTADSFKEIDLRAHEVISIDDDSLDVSPALQPKSFHGQGQTTVSKSFPLPHSKDVASASPKPEKEKKHKDKKNKAAKHEAKLLKRQLMELTQGDPQISKKIKASKAGKVKKDKFQGSPRFPYLFPLDQMSGMPMGPNFNPNPGLIPPSLIPNSDFLSGLASNSALRGLPPPSSLANPFAPLPPDIFPGSSLPRPPLHTGSFYRSHTSTAMKIPTILRRPSLEVIPVENDKDMNVLKPQVSVRAKDRRDKHESLSIPNILQMPPVQPDITIQLNPHRAEQPKREVSATVLRAPTPEPKHEPKPLSLPEPTTSNTFDESQKKLTEKTEKVKEKTHKKEKKDKDGVKIKKKKDKKDKNKLKSKIKKVKDEIKEEKKVKEKKEKKKDKSSDCLVPKLTLKLSSSNSNSPMPSKSPDILKLNIKPVVEKEEKDERLSQKEAPLSREHSPSPELAQISALVTRPQKQKHSKHSNPTEGDSYTSPSSPAAPSQTRKNRPPSSHSQYKRISFKPLCKKSHDDNTASKSEDPAGSSEKLSGPLPTPYYVDEHGNKVWVCPACGKPDNGSPMIGCDGCDGWYHWVCVGITEEPGATEDWFCKSCLTKRTAMVLAGVTTSGKKRSKKTKGDKVRDCQ